MKPILDWKSEHDPLSLNYGIRPVIGDVEERPKQWASSTVLDQGQEGSCVGHGWTGELIASPKPCRVTPLVGHEYAVGVYKAAQLVDDTPGEDYEGTSVLAGAKVVQSRGFIGEYRWAFGIEDVRDAVITSGPVVIGIPWYDEMYETRPSGLVKVGGSVVGGHCLLITGYHPARRIRGEDWSTRFKVFKWRNSWSESYGLNGDGFVRYEDLEALLKDTGEACIPTERNKVAIF